MYLVQLVMNVRPARTYKRTFASMWAASIYWFLIRSGPRSNSNFVCLLRQRFAICEPKDGVVGSAGEGPTRLQLRFAVVRPPRVCNWVTCGT